ncbi:MAG TPA: outer membrane lipoprotein carrier protein LolA [Desulfuromonadales bacterium]|nr:outer membrane lipoprotein carrier protein LolA [Desulfuromonadales bacterium]
MSFLWLLPAFAEARPIAALDGLEALRAGFAGISDFSAEITQEKKLALMRRTMTMSGTVRFKKPDQFFMALNPPYSSRMVLKDTQLQQLAGQGGVPNRIILPPDQGLGRWFAKLATPVTRLPEGIDIQADLTHNIYTLVIRPLSSGQVKGQIKEVMITFLKDGTIRRLAILEQNGDKATMTFKNLRRNIGLTDTDFQLVPIE